MTEFASGELWKSTRQGDPVEPKLPNMRVIRMLGAGGFGTVWLCEQSAPLKREVAVKVMRSLTASPRLRARFDAERRLLARMDHPGIARIFDAGETPDGSLYFVMEYVQGERIGEWCNRQRLDADARLGLLRQVCAAVQHAHSKGIVHLDLTPANILICNVDGKPVVKVIDFGIARLADDPDAVSALIDANAMPMGTMEYMAPEQFAGTRLLDTRTDVHALGVVLYELLSGLLPFEPRQLRAMGSADAVRLLRETDPEPPSRRVGLACRLEPAESTARALARSRTCRQLERELRGELDAVIMRCLEREMDARYETCEALSADLGRYLAHEPVSARSAPMLTRMAKFARRNKVGISAAAVVLLALIGGLAAMTYGLLEAKHQLARSQRLHAFNTKMLESVDPGIAKGMDTRLLKLLFDKSMGTIDEEYADDELLAADAHLTAGIAYRSIGELESAMGHVKKGYALAQRSLDEHDPEFLNAKNAYGVVLLMADDEVNAEPVIESLYVDYERLYGPDHPSTLTALHNIAWLREVQNRGIDAMNAYEVVAKRKAVALGPDHSSTLQSLDNLGEVQRQLGKLDEAEATLADVVERRIRLEGDRSPEALLSRNNYCMVLRSKGDLTTTEPVFRDLIVDMTAICGESHPYTLIATNNLASILRDSGRTGEAEAIYRDLIPKFQAKYGVDANFTIIAMHNLALSLEIQDKDDEAEPLYIEVIDRKTRLHGAKAASTLNSVLNLGAMYFGMGGPRIQDAHRLWTQARLDAQETMGPEHPTSIRASVYRAQTLMSGGDLKEALAMVKEAVRTTPDKLPLDLQVIAYKTLGVVSLSEGNLNEGIDRLSSGYAVAKQIGKTEQARDIAKLIAEAAADEGHDETAAEWAARARGSQ